MSFMLTGYSEYGCQEFILPEMDNANYSITLDHQYFCTPEDIELHFDVVDGNWRFLSFSDNCTVDTKTVQPGQRIKAGDSIHVSIGAICIALVVMEFTPEVGGLQTYRLHTPCQLSVGTDADNHIVCENNPFVSRHHAVLSIGADHCTVSDLSTNGTFVNGRRVVGTERIAYGTCINFFGVQVIWLGDIVAIGSKCGQAQCQLEKQSFPSCEMAPSSPEAGDSAKKYFRRSPRNLPALFRENIEIEEPPQPQKAAQRPLFLTIGPSLTMSIPMIAGTAIAILGAKSTGSSASLYMYTGIIIAVLSAVIGSIWAIVNVRYAKKQEVKGELLRTEKYQAYIAQKEDEIAKKYEYNTQSLNYIYPDAESCSRYNADSPEMWNRNASHDDFLYLRLGVGQSPFQCQIIVPRHKFSLVDDELSNRPQELKDKFGQLKNVPIGIDLDGKRLVGVVGSDKERTAQVMRDLVIQAASHICYTDLKMVFLFDGNTPSEISSWSFARWLPHTWSEDHKIRYYASNKLERSEVCFALANVFRLRAEREDDSRQGCFAPRYIVFISDPDILEGEPVSKYLLASEKDIGVTTVILAGRYEQLPNNCVDIIQNDTDFCGIMNTELGDAARQQIAFDKIEPEAADEFARTLSGIEVRETESGGEIPDTLTFLEMYHVNTLEELKIGERWLKSRTYENMRVPIGQKAGGSTWSLDIHEKYHGPHGLVAGTTGSGKSETLQTYILSLAVNFSPNDVAFFLIDFKGGGMANMFADLPHTAGYISNLSGNQIHRAMVSIKSENRRRQRVFGEFGVNHINQYTKLLKSGEATTPIPHLFIVIDEFAELKREEPDFMRELISVAQVGRSLGVHLILATQKPGGTVDDNIWSNTRFRICLRVQDRQDSNDVLHKPDAAYLTQAGRGCMQVGNDEIYEEFQSAWSGAVYSEDLAAEHLEIASIWSDTGRSEITGTGQKLRCLEHRREKWLRALINCAQAAAVKLDVSLAQAMSENGFLPLLYQGIRECGYDYPLSSINSARALEFIQEYVRRSEAPDAVQAAMKEFRKQGRQFPEIKEKTQLTALVEYLARIAKEHSNGESFRLWLPILPQEVYLFDVCREQMFDGEQWPENAPNASLSVPVGIYDDPANQTQDTLTVDLSGNGNLAVCGSVVSGKSTFLQTFLYALVNKYDPNQVNIYVLDYSNHLLAPFENISHCGGVVFDNQPDRTEKLFVLLSGIIAERKQMFQGGSYAQYIRANGPAVPYIVLAIDNYTGFREKTENRYESDLLTLSREGVNYGIYMVMTAGGFGAGEIQNRIADNFRSVICLEMGDRFKYSEILRTHHFDVLPEANIKGRGLANVNGRILEYQTALALRASNDYERAERLNICFEEMNRSWNGKPARKIPSIPENPAWEDFLSCVKEEGSLLQSSGQLPFGWNTKDASIASIALSKTYCWLISGRARTGKTNLLKALANSAALSDSERYIIDFNSGKLRKFAEENRATYVGDDKAMFEMLRGLVSEFKERNAKKQTLVAAGCDEDEIYREMSGFIPIYLFIDDLAEFLKIAYNPSEGVGAVSGFLENITEKGFFHNIFIIAAMDQAKMAQCSIYKVFGYISSYKTGIHLGGNTAAQRLLDFSSLSYQEQSKTTKPGLGLLPPDDYVAVAREVTIPNVKR